VEVSRDNPIFGHHDICSISKQMGIPILVKSESVAPEWRGKIHRGMTFDPCENRAVRLLMFRADVEDWDNWGSVDAFKWDNGIGGMMRIDCFAELLGFEMTNTIKENGIGWFRR